MILVTALMFVDVEKASRRLRVPCPHHGFANLGQLGQRLHRPPPEVQNLAEGPGAATCLSAMSPSHWIVSMYGSMPYAICININMLIICYLNLNPSIAKALTWSVKAFNGATRSVRGRFPVQPDCCLCAWLPRIPSRKHTKVDHCEIWPSRSYFQACCQPLF